MNPGGLSIILLMPCKPGSSITNYRSRVKFALIRLPPNSLFLISDNDKIKLKLSFNKQTMGVSLNLTYEEFKAEFNLRLNAQQEAAVRQINGPTLLLAVPGSGKTSVIVARIAYMLYCHNIDSRSILTMTYTVAATDDMRRRYASKFGPEFAERLEFRTINGVCAGIIRHYERTKQRTAFDLVSSDRDISKIIRDLYISLSSEYPSDSDIKDIRTQITYCKNMELTEEEIDGIKLENSSCDFPQIYRVYLKHMLENRLMDFDDQLVYARDILRSHGDILGYFQNRYIYINVDEAQDTSKIQHNIIRLLASKNRNLFMVGDEDQSIYGFRAAYPEELMSFGKNYPEAKILLMEQNYRSTKTIAERANAFIKSNSSRYDKNMFSENAVGDKLIHSRLADCNRQYNYLAKIAGSCQSETAVLYRNNDSAIPLVDLLEKNGIPYRCRQLEGLFFSHYIVRDITDTIRFAFEPRRGELFQNIYYKLDCRLKKDVVISALKLAERAEKPVLDLLIESGSFGLGAWAKGKLKALRTHLTNMRSDTSFVAVKRIVDYMGYGDYLHSRQADSSKINILLALANQNPELRDFLQRIDELSGLISEGGSNARSKFILSTIHSSKGLEYDKVILIDVEDGIFPRVAEPKPGEKLSAEDAAALEEERRIFYVGVTRAKKQLEIITYEKEYGKMGKPVPSFIRNLLPPEQRPPAPTPASSRQGSSEYRELAEGYPPGTTVEHKSFGSGTIEELEDNIVTINFKSGIRKTFDLKACVQKKLIIKLS